MMNDKMIRVAACYLAMQQRNVIDNYDKFWDLVHEIEEYIDDGHEYDDGDGSEVPVLREVS